MAVMIDCPVVVTVCQSDSYHDRLRQVVGEKQHTSICVHGGRIRGVAALVPEAGASSTIVVSGPRV